MNQHAISPVGRMNSAGSSTLNRLVVHLADKKQTQKDELSRLSNDGSESPEDVDQLEFDE